MAVSIKVDLSKELAQEPAEIQKRIAALQGAGLAKQIGRGVAGVFSSHLRSLDATRVNLLGGKRTHFYADAAKATSSDGREGEAIVTVAQQGIRQRLEGGEIKPTGGRKYLTIPARAEAYGRRAGEFANLKFVKLSGGRAMLVEVDSQDVKVGRARKDGTRKVSPGAARGGGAYYWLVPRVTQKGDRGVLPSDEAISDEVRKVVRAAILRGAR